MNKYYHSNIGLSLTSKRDAVRMVVSDWIIYGRSLTFNIVGLQHHSTGFKPSNPEEKKRISRP